MILYIYCIVRVPVDGVYEESMKTNGPIQIEQMAKYYNVYEDLFEEAYFTPVTPLDVRFSSGVEVESRVFAGNLIAPREVSIKLF
jgi:hypothetical protein